MDVVAATPAGEHPAANARRELHVAVRRRIGPIGFDLGRSALRAVQAELGGERPLLKAATAVPYPCSKQDLLADPRRLRRFIRDALAGEGFRGRNIVSCTPTDNLRLLSLEYPITEGVSDSAAIVQQLQQRVDDDLDDLVVDYVLARDSGAEGKRLALVAVANVHKQVAYLDTLHKAGLHVLGLEIGPIAIRRLVEQVSRAAQRPNTLVVNCGVENTYLTVTSGRRLMLDRGVRFGERYVVERLACALDLPQADAEHVLRRYGVDPAIAFEELLPGIISTQDIVSTLLAVITPLFNELTREINKVIAYVRSQLHGADIQQVYLLGSVARWPGADTYLSNLIQRPVAILNPFDCFAQSTGAARAPESKPVAGMALAAGCALSELRLP